jgi:hypothetical protein
MALGMPAAPHAVLSHREPPLWVVTPAENLQGTIDSQWLDALAVALLALILDIGIIAAQLARAISRPHDLVDRQLAS